MPGTPAAQRNNEMGMGPVSGADQTYGTPGAPASGAPASGAPASGVPASGVPASGIPASGVPASGAPPTYYDPPTPQYGAHYGGTPSPGTPSPGTPNPGTPAYGPFRSGPTDAYPTSGGAPWTAAPISGAGPTSSPPSWSTTDPVSGAAAPVSGAADPISGGANPVSGPTGPTSGGGTDEYGLAVGGGNRFGTSPGSTSHFGGGTGSPVDPYSGALTDSERFGFDVSPRSSGPRIEPTPKQPKSRLIVPALAGLVAGLLIFGTAGWFAGRATAPEPGPAAPTVAQPSPGPSSSQGVYEQNQVSINQPKFTGPLGTVAQGFMPYLSGCSRNGDKGGPALNKGEKARVRCEMDAMSVIFVEYATTTDRDKARVSTLGQNVDARTLTPGVGAAVERATPSGRASGNYVEYAYKISGRTVAGIWWDDNSTPVAAYLLAYWKEGTGQKWEPMRDIWARYA